MRPLNRMDPLLPAQAMKTYQIAQPVSSHFRPASCAEVGCQPYEKGWMTVIEKMIDTNGQLEHTVRASGRKFQELREEGKITFIFEPGQPCFKAMTHKVSLERPAIYVVREGDWRGNPRGTSPRQHARPEDWVEDFKEHQDRLTTAIEKG